MSRDTMPVAVDEIVKAKRPADYPHNGPPPLTSEERTRFDAEVRKLEADNPPKVNEDPFTVRPGGSWIFDRPDNVPAIWGAGDVVAWAEDEALMLVGADGSGKTALAHQLITRMIGLDTRPLLGLPVTPRQRVLYLALDRPAQAARGFRRLVGTIHRADLDDRLKVIDWPIGMLDEDPDLLLKLAQDAGCDTVLVDSVKDCILEPSTERSGQALKSAYQLAIAEGVEVGLLHHDRKATQEGRTRRLMKLADVYGSRFIVAGCGSVIALNGTSGDITIDLRHLKQPSGEFGPLKVTFDFESGDVTLFEGGDLYAIVKAAKAGITAHDAARLLYETDKPTNAERERARQSLKRLVTKDLIFEKPAQGSTEPARFYLLTVLTDPLTVPLTAALTEGF